MHHRDNPHMIRLVQINQRVWKFAGQGALCRRTESKEAFRLAPDLDDKPLNFVMKPVAKRRSDVGVVLNSANIFFIGIRMKNMWLHRLRIF